MQIIAPHPVMLIHENWGQVILRQMVLRADCEATLRKNIREMPCAWEPRRRCGETYILALPTRFMLLLRGHSLRCEVGFYSSEGAFLFDLLLLKSVLLHDGNPNKKVMKTKDNVNVFHLYIVHFFIFLK